MKIKWLCLALLLALSGCRSLAPAVGETQAVFEVTECRFPTEPNQDVDCGDLIVPEDRKQLDGNSIRLHVAIFHPGGIIRSDPVIFLHGGPGQRTLDWITESYENAFRYLFPNRDFIVFDQRGTGYAQPRLSCSFQEGDYLQSLAQDQRVGYLEWQAGRMAECQAELVAQGVNLSAYTGQASAADINDLIAALEYRHVNLFGGSYGSCLALTFMQEYGAQGRVRSVVLDSVLPPQVDLFAERAANAQRTFDAIFAACAADDVCNAAYPNLESVFFNLLEQLDTEPVSVRFLNPFNGEEQDMVVNSFRMLEAFYRASYRGRWIPRLPKMLYDLQAGDYGLFVAAIEDAVQLLGGLDAGVYYAIQCSGEAVFTSSEAVEATSADLHPLVRAYFDGGNQAMLRVCDGWEIPSVAPDQNQPVVSDVPTLLLSGSFDPVTPPTWAFMAAETLSDGYAYEFPDTAHSAIATGYCAQRITVDFVQNPVEPDNECLHNLPRLIFEAP
jgi:pimeloyl-ACP methyl ester carboxylesterase